MNKSKNIIIVVIVVFLTAIIGIGIYFYFENTITIQQDSSGIKVQNVDEPTTRKIVALILKKYGKNMANSIVSISYNEVSNWYVVVPEQTMSKKQYELLGETHFLVDATLTEIKGGMYE